MDSIKAVYRNVRENYEYRLGYDEAGDFFIREMELKRIYKEHLGNIMKTGLVRRHLSITGFYHLASYGERVRMPALLMLASIILSLFAYYASYS